MRRARPSRRLRFLSAAALLAAIALAHPAAAAGKPRADERRADERTPGGPPAWRLERARHRLDALKHAEQIHAAAAAAAQKAAQAASAKADALGDQAARAAQSVRVLENATAVEAAKLAALGQQTIAARAALAADAAALARLLPVMQRLALAPSGTLLAIPEPPAQTVRGAAVIAGIAAAIETRAAAVREETAQIASLTDLATIGQARLNAAIAAQTAAQNAIKAQLAAANAAELAANQDAANEAAAAAEAGRKAQSLQAMVASLQRQADADEAAARAGAAPAGAAPEVGPSEVGGTLVAGSVRSIFGEPTLAGPATGMTFAAAPGALVSAPCGGPVLFADRFQAYGLLVIVDCGGGYDAVVSGMAHLSVAAGQRVVHGQPLGRMQAASGQAGTGGADAPLLYFELRHDGTPVDPAPFLAHKA